MTLLQTHYLHEDDKLIIARSQDCTAIAEDAKARHNEGLYGSSEVKHAARLPNVIVEKYCNDAGISFEQFMGDETHIRRITQHPDNAMFRIWPGKF